MQKIQLSIPEPCHENWQQMTPTDQGRYCNACAKEVVDFSMMTDSEVLNYFTSITHGNVCGRTLPSQLNRTIARPKEPKKRLFWYWNYIMMFFMFFGKTNAAKAQGGMKPVATEQLELKQSANINEALVGRTGGVEIIKNRIIEGKVIDTDGKPVAFASINIKGSNTGVSADVNGEYKLKIKGNERLVISGAGFMETEIPVGQISKVTTVLETGRGWLGEVVVYKGGISANYDDGTPDKVRNVAVIKVKDETTGKIMPNVILEIVRNRETTDTAYTDNKGKYKIKGIGEYGKCFVKVQANGYEPNEFVIFGDDFKDRKKEWEIFLRKQKHIVRGASDRALAGTETRIRLGQISMVPQGKGALYVVDRKIMPDGADISPDDVEDYSVLQAPEATALFGEQASGGAVVITTRKSKEISMQDVVLVSEFGIKRSTSCSSSCLNDTNKVNPPESIVEQNASATQFKIFPNPVQRGSSFNINFKLKQTGIYKIVITDANDKLVLQKQINATAKEVTEQILPDARWSSGVYFINLVDGANKLISKTSFIFQ